MQVCCKVEEIKGEAGPGPPAPAATSLLLALASVVTTARLALQTIMPNPTVAPFVTVGGVNAGILPSLEKKVRKTSQPGDTEQVVAQWRHLVTSMTALDFIHWSMRAVLHSRIAMAIKMASNGGTFVRCHLLFCLIKT